MLSLTENERKALLILFKEFDSNYSANSLSKKLGISHVGAQKLLKRLKAQGLTESKEIGKSIIHKINLEDDFSRKLISFLLAEEANNFKRWKDEFKELYKKGRIILIYGSAIKNYKAAEDIDIMAITKKDESKEIDRKIISMEDTLPKKIHCLKLTKTDLLRNARNKQEAIVDIIKNAIVLYGQDDYVEVLKDVTGF